MQTGIVALCFWGGGNASPNYKLYGFLGVCVGNDLLKYTLSRVRPTLKMDETCRCAGYLRLRSTTPYFRATVLYGKPVPCRVKKESRALGLKRMSPSRATDERPRSAGPDRGRLKKVLYTHHTHEHTFISREGREAKVSYCFDKKINTRGALWISLAKSSV